MSKSTLGYSRTDQPISEPAQEADDESEELPSFAYSRFWNSLCDDILGTRQGGAKVLVDAEDAALGCGKTTAAVALAETLSKAFDYEITKDDLTLSASEYVQRYQDHPGSDQPSVIILDEAVGGGAGDARRSMSNKNVELGRAWQTMRAKRVVTIVTLAHWGDLDKRLKRLADYRLHCKRKPVGKYRPYRIRVGFDDGKPRTKKLDDGIWFPNVKNHDDSLYQDLHEKKEALWDSQTWDADDLVEDASKKVEDTGMTVKDVAKEILDGDVEEYVSQHPVNHRRYVDSDLIYEDYNLSKRAANRAKKQIEREVDLNE